MPNSKCDLVLFLKAFKNPITAIKNTLNNTIPLKLLLIEPKPISAVIDLLESIERAFTEPVLKY